MDHNNFYDGHMIRLLNYENLIKLRLFSDWVSKNISILGSTVYHNGIQGVGLVGPYKVTECLVNYIHLLLQLYAMITFYVSFPLNDINHILDLVC